METHKLMTQRYDIVFLRKEAEGVLCRCGISNKDAQVIVDSMLEADLNGVDTHGIRMVYSYVHKLERGDFNINMPIEVKSSPSFTILDSNNVIGAISARKAVDICAKKATEYGVHTVFARNCNTFGPGFYFAELLAKSGMIGFVCCNSPAAMPAFNGKEPLLGTNPLAFACPSKTKGTIILDMATSIVAKSRFETARLNGEQLQPGWALDEDGNPTIDPIKAIKGFVLPMAGFKGYGIAMAIDILSGLLSGSAYLNKVNKFYSQNGGGMNVGQMFVAIDPTIVYEGDFAAEMDRYIDTLRKSKVEEGKRIAIPGDDRIAKRELALREGILLSTDTVEKLESVFNKKLKLA